MTLSEWLGLSGSGERALVRLTQFVLVALTAYGLATLRLGMTANAGLALAVTLLPAVLRREFDYAMDAGLVLWISAAVFLHSVGTLGPYQRYHWYDEITHTVSATLIAGVGYASLRAFERHSDAVDVTPPFRTLFVVVFVLAAGVFWEIAEFASETVAGALGVRGPLVVYGIDDIVSDIVFNTVGGVLVALWGTGPFRGLAGFFRRLLGARSDE